MTKKLFLLLIIVFVLTGCSMKSGGGNTNVSSANGFDFNFTDEIIVLSDMGERQLYFDKDSDTTIISLENPEFKCDSGNELVIDINDATVKVKAHDNTESGARDDCTVTFKVKANHTEYGDKEKFLSKIIGIDFTGNAKKDIAFTGETVILKDSSSKVIPLSDPSIEVEEAALLTTSACADQLEISVIGKKVSTKLKTSPTFLGECPIEIEVKAVGNNYYTNPKTLSTKVKVELPNLEGVSFSQSSAHLINDPVMLSLSDENAVLSSYIVKNTTCSDVIYELKDNGIELKLKPPVNEENCEITFELVINKDWHKETKVEVTVDVTKAALAKLIMADNVVLSTIMEKLDEPKEYTVLINNENNFDLTVIGEPTVSHECVYFSKTKLDSNVSNNKLVLQAIPEDYSDLTGHCGDEEEYSFNIKIKAIKVGYIDYINDITLKINIEQGTEKNPYTLNKVEDFKKISKLVANTKFYYKLTKDINIGTWQWAEEEKADFYGTLDGGNNLITLSGFTVNSYGIFRNFGGTIKNLRVKTEEISGFNSALGVISQKVITGNAKIDNTHLDVKIKAGEYGGMFVGGVAAEVPSDSKIIITNSSVKGELKGQTVGGFIGRIASGGIGEIRVSVAEVLIDGTGYVGGFLGDASDISIQDSYSIGKVSGKNVGGHLGRFVKGDVQNSYSMASLDAKDNSFMGGLIGESHAAITVKNSLSFNYSLTSTSPDSSSGYIIGNQESSNFSKNYYYGNKVIVNGNIGDNANKNGENINYSTILSGGGFKNFFNNVTYFGPVWDLNNIWDMALDEDLEEQNRLVLRWQKVVPVAYEYNSNKKYLLNNTIKVSAVTSSVNLVFKMEPNFTYKVGDDIINNDTKAYELNLVASGKQVIDVDMYDVDNNKIQTFTYYLFIERE